MARKSRTEEQTNSVPTHEIPPFFKTAIYARLSVEDKEAQSLDNQIMMVQKYIEKKYDLSLQGVFYDNGLTGTNFNRPGYESLMEEIRLGRINCIVVKDLSRFGRNYMEAGNYLEVIFPRLGVRFISISDNYDSFDPRCQGEGICIALKNMINAYYAKDISDKIRSAYAVKRKNGEFTGKCPPFGYIKSPENVNKLIVDKDAAEIVSLIFRLRLEGLSIYKISRYLTDNNIPNPGHYRYIKGIHKEERHKTPMAWDNTVVKDMLESVEYLGHLAMGKTQTVNGKQSKLPREEWVIAENTHEAIISQADFDAVAEQFRHDKLKRSTQQKHNREKLPENIFEGIIFCKDCGRAYRRIPNTHRDKVTYRLSYICVYCNKNSPKYKYKHFKPDDLYNAVCASLRKEINICSDINKKIKKFNNSKGEKERQNEADKIICITKQRLNRLPTLKFNLYNNFREGIIEKSEFDFLSQKYDVEKASLIAELERQYAEKEKTLPQFADDKKWFSDLARFVKGEQLTRELLLALVERIDVSGDFNVEIKLRFKDEYKRIAGIIGESGVQLA